MQEKNALWMAYASFSGSFVGSFGGSVACWTGGVGWIGCTGSCNGVVLVLLMVASSSSFSCLIGGSSDPSFEELTSSTSSFLLLPFGAGSRGVRQYVTVRVTTCRTLTLPGLSVAESGAYSRGENDALHGAALSGVDE